VRREKGVLLTFDFSLLTFQFLFSLVSGERLPDHET
jgi:hypothetical protein